MNSATQVYTPQNSVPTEQSKPTDVHHVSIRDVKTEITETTQWTYVDDRVNSTMGERYATILMNPKDAHATGVLSSMCVLSVGGSTLSTSADKTMTSFRTETVTSFRTETKKKNSDYVLELWLKLIPRST